MELHNLSAKLFREYDIRGIADAELTNDFSWSLGRALADYLKAQDEDSIYVGQDVRASSPRLANALTAGLETGGIKVTLLNPGPTPMLYYATHEALPGFSTRSGVMVTGSHNPPEFNGFKMVVKGRAIYGAGIQELMAPTAKYLEGSPGPGTIRVNAKTIDRENEYLKFIKSNLRIAAPKNISVVIDAGNGAAGPLGLAAYKELGLNVIPIFCDFDSRFPNHHPDPTVPKNLELLVQKVIETKSNLGIAFDGDGDRIGVVTSTGQILFGDQILIYLARDVLKEVPGAKVISEVKSSQVLFDELRRMGGEPILWKTGHSLIKAKLKETGAELAGEMSGHIFFKNRFFGYDDAIYAGARFVEAYSKNAPETLDEFLNSLPKVYNTPELRCDCPDEEKFALVESFTALAKESFGPEKVLDIDGARVTFPGLGWGLLRASNTQPVVVMRFEASSPDNLLEVKGRFDVILGRLTPRIQIPA